jgi:hypothetical protein
VINDSILRPPRGGLGTYKAGDFSRLTSTASGNLWFHSLSVLLTRAHFFSHQAESLYICLLSFFIDSFMNTFIREYVLHSVYMFQDSSYLSTISS